MYVSELLARRLNPADIPHDNLRNEIAVLTELARQALGIDMPDITDKQLKVVADCGHMMNLECGAGKMTGQTWRGVRPAFCRAEKGDGVLKKLTSMACVRSLETENDCRRIRP